MDAKRHLSRGTQDGSTPYTPRQELFILFWHLHGRHLCPGHGFFNTFQGGQQDANMKTLKSNTGTAAKSQFHSSCARTHHPPQQQHSVCNQCRHCLASGSLLSTHCSLDGSKMEEHLSGTQTAKGPRSQEPGWFSGELLQPSLLWTFFRDLLTASEPSENSGRGHIQSC